MLTVVLGDVNLKLSLFLSMFRWMMLVCSSRYSYMRSVDNSMDATLVSLGILK